MADKQKQQIIIGEEDGGNPMRVAYIKREDRVAVDHPREETEMSSPALLMRGIIAFELIIILIGIFSYAFNAPLEEIANPQHTPNPAKAPWYFLGLQELLHYFHPVVAGILIPTLLVIALAVIPYFKVNIERQPLWDSLGSKSLPIFTGVVVAVFGAMALYHAWAIAVPTAMLYLLAILPLIGIKGGLVAWISRRSLSEWIMVWFVTVVTLLTIIGTSFRGPGWSWVWPW